MNRSLRGWHFRLVSVLAPLAAVTLAAAVAVRRTAPPNQMPAALAPPSTPNAPVVDRRLVSEAGLKLELHLLNDSAGPPVVELTPLVEPHTADLLVYWSAGPAGETLPADAILLGPLSGLEPVRYPLPAAARVRSGDLVLYTTAGNRVLGHVDLARTETPTP